MGLIMVGGIEKEIMGYYYKRKGNLFDFLNCWMNILYFLFLFLLNVIIFYERNKYLC